MVDFNLSLIGDITKLFNKGNIVKVYDKMYTLADELAASETKNYKNC